MTNGEKHIEELLNWYKEAVKEDGVCYLTSEDKNTLAYAIKCCKHFEDIKKDIESLGLREEPSRSNNPTGSTVNDDLADGVSKKDGICIQDKYDKRILSRRYGNGFDCNNCGRSWIACKDDIIEGYEVDVKLRCPYCHNMINIPRNFNWY